VRTLVNVASGVLAPLQGGAPGGGGVRKETKEPMVCLIKFWGEHTTRTIRRDPTQGGNSFLWTELKTPSYDKNKRQLDLSEGERNGMGGRMEASGDLEFTKRTATPSSQKGDEEKRYRFRRRKLGSGKTALRGRTAKAFLKKIDIVEG